MATAAWMAAAAKAASEPALLLSIYDGTNTFRCLSRSCAAISEPVAITNVDSVASEIDPLTRSTTVGELVVDVLDAWARPIIVNYRLRGKKATVKLGFAELAEADFDGLFVGEISDAEFQRARDAMIGAVRSKGTKEPPPRNPDLDVLRQRHFAATQRASGSEKPPAPISPATPTIPPTVPSVPKSLMAPVTRPDPVRSIPPVQPKPSETLQSSYTPNHPTSLSDPSQHDPAPRRDAVVRRPTILSDERFLREASGKDPEDPSESAAQ